MKFSRLKQSVAFVFSSICTMPLIAGDEYYLARLNAITLDRGAAEAQLLSNWAHRTADGGDQLRATLPHKSPAQLLAATDAQDAAELNAALLGTTLAAASPGHTADDAVPVGSSGNGLSYIPVAPCRVVDTRYGGGAIPTGGFREYYVWGAAIGDQNGGTAVGNPTNCPAPAGEPIAVHANFTVVPSFQGGNLRAFPADGLLPNASLINYRQGPPVANAATVKTYASLVDRDIEVYASGKTHLIIDVMGYYYEQELPVGVEFAHADGLAGIATWPSATIVRSMSVTAPQAGYLIVNASGGVKSATAGNDAGSCSLSLNSTALDSEHAHGISDYGVNTSDGNVSLTRGFSVSPGNHNLYMICSMTAGGLSIIDASMTAVFSPHRY